MTRLILYKTIFICCLIFVLQISAGSAMAGVLFSENFNSWPDVFLKDGINVSPYKWKSSATGQLQEIGGIAHYAGEITTPGRTGASDRSFKCWRNDSITTNYDSFLSWWGDSLIGKREIYIRWYMKIPGDFQVTNPVTGTMNYLKLFRIKKGSTGIGNTAPNTGEYYVNFNGATFSGARLQMTGKPAGTWKTLKSVSSMRDGKWHCHEIRFKLNTDTGKNDGVIQYWFDGKLEQSYTGLALMASDSEYLLNTGIGIGNTSKGSRFQKVWRAIEFDDYTVSTSYIGPHGSSSISYSSNSSGSGSSAPSPPGKPWIIK